MKTAHITNFCGTCPIKISAHNHPQIGNLVNIIQDGGSLSFHHPMTPEQAREMASALVVVADSFEEPRKQNETS